MIDLAGFWAALDAVPVADDAEALYDVSTEDGRLRRENLTRYLSLVGDQADMLLVAEAPGWRGMTNTGVPFTSMRELGPAYLVPPEPTAPWEASSRVVQAALADWNGPLPVAWAIFPHHPFAAPDRLTNRTPRPSEVRDGAPGALALAGIDAIAVRHPAQGGAKQFTEQLLALNA